MDRTFHLSSMEQTFQPPSQKLPLGHHSYCDLSKKKGILGIPKNGSKSEPHSERALTN
ncbi:hypothetical protein E1A91_A10G198700v1 [Gossypium mustelinum]|uniref:Uncharacterized protein n=1 Tax=Gossypium mustelinum TaxID=34275 RepID=A0A5D2XPI4_GOSMU|nr:hypothetical protein E1A91_A10G198700v1 [Gossypium mustelinum]TYJ15663.1 hypothetical protein E1A91_A10G198700v1 [Gossypium mustelinum]